MIFIQCIFKSYQSLNFLNDAERKPRIRRKEPMRINVFSRNKIDSSGGYPCFFSSSLKIFRTELLVKVGSNRKEILFHFPIQINHIPVSIN